MLAPEYAFGVSCVFFIGGYLLGTIHASGYMETTAISEAWWHWVQSSTAGMLSGSIP